MGDDPELSGGGRILDPACCSRDKSDQRAEWVSGFVALTWNCHVTSDEFCHFLLGAAPTLTSRARDHRGAARYLAFFLKTERCLPGPRDAQSLSDLLTNWKHR